MGHAEIGGEFFFKFLAFGAENVVAALDDFEDSAVDGLGLINARQGYLFRHITSHDCYGDSEQNTGHGGGMQGGDGSG